jgi:hypothetical protein
MPDQIDPPKPCRFCLLPTYHQDKDGPLHDCCEKWQEVIAKGTPPGAKSPCPACEVSRKISRAVTDFDLVRRDPDYGGPDFVPTGRVISSGPWV